MSIHQVSTVRTTGWMRACYGSLFVMMVLTITPNVATAEQWRLGVKIFSTAGGGVKIVEVLADSPASDIGLRSGYVILSLNGQLVNNPDEVRNKLFSSGDSVDIIFWDGSGYYQITAPLVATEVRSTKNGKVEKTTRLMPKGGKPKPIPVSDPRKK